MHLVKIMSINLMITTLGVIVLELVFGNWFNPNELETLSGNIPRSCVIERSVEEFYRNPAKLIKYTRDQFGLRGTFSNPSEINMLTVGGSTTDQRLIDDDFTWQRILQENLRNKGYNITVANAGVDGQSTFGHIKNFEFWYPNIPGLSPKYILYYIGINDLYKGKGYRFDNVINTSRGKTVLFIKKRSAMYSLYTKIKGFYEAQSVYGLTHRKINFQDQEWTNQPLLEREDHANIMDGRLDDYSERLEILIQKTRSFGSIPILVTQPSRMYRIVNQRIEGVKRRQKFSNKTINGVDYYFMIRKLDEVTIKTSMKFNVYCFDLAGAELDWNDDDFYDFFHMTPTGIKKIGDLISGFIAKKNIRL